MIIFPYFSVRWYDSNRGSYACVFWLDHHHVAIFYVQIHTENRPQCLQILKQRWVTYIEEW
jgi:hypothetical protein